MAVDINVTPTTSTPPADPVDRPADKASRSKASQEKKPQPSASETSGPGLAAATREASVAKPAATATNPVSYQLAIPAELEVAAGHPSRLPLRLDPVPDAAANLLLIVRGLPTWLKLSKGSEIGSELWVLSAHEARELMIHPAPAASGSVELRLELVTREGNRLSAVITQVKATGRANAVPAPVPARPRPDAKAEAMLHLIAGGDILLDAGELPEARERYRRAAEAGSADAAMRLAATYDTNEITRLGLTAAAIDVAQARRWYRHALKLGASDAADRLRNLERQ
jgi:hypothetical protein